MVVRSPSQALVVALVALASLASLAACSSPSSSSGAASIGPLPEVFSGYCTGTLTVDLELSRPSGAGSWSSGGFASEDKDMAAAGTTFLVGKDFGAWQGYVLRTSGEPAMLAPAGRARGLVKGTDFTSDCTPDSGAAMSNVLLAPVTLYPNEDLSGAPCTLAAGTKLTKYSFAAVKIGEVGRVSAEQVTEACKFDVAYSKDLTTASLLSK